MAYHDHQSVGLPLGNLNAGSHSMSTKQTWPYVLDIALARVKALIFHGTPPTNTELRGSVGPPRYEP